MDMAQTGCLSGGNKIINEYEFSFPHKMCALKNVKQVKTT